MSNCNGNQQPVVPSPVPPWARPVKNPLIQLLGDGSVPLALDPEVTYLRAAAGGFATGINLTLPNGNYPQQFKRIYIPGDAVTGTATWVVAGNFAGGFTVLTFNALGTSALLEWDGVSWQLVGGNAALSANNQGQEGQSN